MLAGPNTPKFFDLCHVSMEVNTLMQQNLGLVVADNFVVDNSKWLAGRHGEDLDLRSSLDIIPALLVRIHHQAKPHISSKASATVSPQVITP